jgi:hypothetical protein
MSFVARARSRKTQFERDAALDDEEWRVGSRDALENAGHDHVGDPRTNPALGDAELARVGSIRTHSPRRPTANLISPSSIRAC